MDWDTYSIDDWTGDSDEGWCYTCQDWVTTKEDDKECCSTCGNHLDGVVGDEFAHPTTAKTAISLHLPYTEAVMYGVEPVADSHGVVEPHGGQVVLPH